MTNEVTPNTQEYVVLQHLKEGNTISSMTAFSMWHFTRLSAIIHRLRSYGYNIVTENKAIINALGHYSTYAVYRLENSDE